MTEVDFSENKSIINELLELNEFNAASIMTKALSFSGDFSDYVKKENYPTDVYNRLTFIH